MRCTTVAFLVSFAGTAAAQDNSWMLDRAHSRIQFEVIHMALSEVAGTFKEYDITFVSSNEDFSDAKINAMISVASINTENERRDNHLRSDDFFNAEAFPMITFASTSFQHIEGNKYRILGDLTIRDVTKSVAFEAEHKGTIRTPQGIVTGWTATKKINCFDYNLKWNRVIEKVGLVAGRDVTITLNLEFRKQARSGPSGG
ncbi:MAG: YceI family protein [Ignavibacteriales bacterium]|nr:YceI family protein [Ignavibacteriales bacterium]